MGMMQRRVRVLLEGDGRWRGRGCLNPEACACDAESSPTKTRREGDIIIIRFSTLNFQLSLLGEKGQAPSGLCAAWIHQ